MENPVLCKFNGYFDHLYVNGEVDPDFGRMYCNKGTLATGFMYNAKGRLVPFCESCHKSFVETLEKGARKYNHPEQALHALYAAYEKTDKVFYPLDEKLLAEYHTQQAQKKPPTEEEERAKDAAALKWLEENGVTDPRTR